VRLTAPDQAFLASHADPAPAAILLGAPLDLTETFHSGTRAGPDSIRRVSDVLETYSPALDADLVDIPLADWGNVELTNTNMEQDLANLAEAVGSAAELALPIMLGGEHTATVAAIQALAGRHPGLTVVQLDAHTDLRDDYDGVRFSHATVMQRIADIVGVKQIAQFGIRSGTREEFQRARGCLYSGPGLAMDRATRDRIASRAVYLTVDIDVLDPSSAPGTGCPEPGGPSFADLLAFIYGMRGLNVIGVDVMEVLPSVDVNDVTSVAAAKIVREAALLFGRARQPRR
jgi:agmatinase